MDNDAHKNGLYRWKRLTDDRVYSRAQKVTTKNDIENWIQAVETATDHATQKVLHPNLSAAKRYGKMAATHSANRLREDDTALTEAQELLSQWMNEKVHLDVMEDSGCHGDEADSVAKQRFNAKREWDHLLENNYEEFGMKVNPQPSINDQDPYAYLEAVDDDSAVQKVLDHMMKKNLVEESFTQDLGFNHTAKYRDPRMKMELRHQQVKENREKRETELEKRRKARQSKKEAEHQAKQMLLKEERVRTLQAKREEQEIKKEMARLRKEMAEQRKNLEDRKKKEQTDQAEILHLAKMAVQQEEEDKRQQEVERERQKEEKHRKLLVTLGQVEARLEAANLKCLQKHFSAWYALVLERRLALGKAKALFDWKLMLKAFNAWKAYVRAHRLDLEAKQHQLDVISSHRKTLQAESHHSYQMLRKYFVAWELWVKKEQEKRELERVQEKTKGKMAALLEAASSGKLWQGETTETSVEGKSLKPGGGQDDIDAFFQSKVHQPRPSSSRSTASSAQSLATVGKTTSKNGSTNVPSTKNSHIPREAWQVTRKHLTLTREEMAQMGEHQEGDRTQFTDQELRQRFGTQPWMNRKYVPNSFEHRNNAQIQLLRDQQKQLKEQQRMIQELQYQHNQEELSKQIATQHAILEKLTKHLLPGQQEGVLMHASSSDPSKRDGVISPQNKSPDKDVNPVKSETHADSVSMTAETKATSQSGDHGNSGIATDRSSASNATAASINTMATNASKQVNNKYLRTLKSMEERAAERARLKAEREEKRRKAEEERLEKLKEEEERLLREQEEEKRARAKAYKEKKKLERERELQKQEMEERLKRLHHKATEHYKVANMKYRGLLPFKKLVEMQRRNEMVAKQHFDSCLLRCGFREWQRWVRGRREEKEKMADQMYNYIIIRHYFTNWSKFKHHTEILEGRSKRIYQRNLKSKVLNSWYDYAQMEKERYSQNVIVASEHYTQSLLKRCFRAIKNYPQQKKRNEEKQKRISEMRQKVLELIPDYKVDESMPKTVESLELP